MIRSAVIRGIEAQHVDVEVGVGIGRYAFRVVGLGRTEIKESEHRLQNAFDEEGFEWPDDQITVNLAPADIPKSGTSLDLPIALAILERTKQIRKISNNLLYAVGELSLDGQVRPARGALTIARSLPDGATLIAPAGNEHELALLRQIKGAQKDYFPYVINNLSDAVAILNGREGRLAQTRSDDLQPIEDRGTDFAEVKGQSRAKRALEVAAAGGHNVLLIGPPGEGKSLLAKAMPTILPKLKPEEIIELTSIYSASGKLQRTNSYVHWRPYRKVHHTTSRQALVGGGSGFPQPGEITLAHRGVLFLDEILEFGRGLLETLRQPLEDGVISLQRTAGVAEYPCEMILIAAMNPCPCGLDGEYLCRKCKRRLSVDQKDCPDCGSRDRNSRCTYRDSEKQLYKARLSGPIMDRIDLKIRVGALSAEDRFSSSQAERSNIVRKRVESARDAQANRFLGNKFLVNARIPGGLVDSFCDLHPSAVAAMREIAKRVPELTTRGHDKLLKVARTVADLHRSARVYKKHIAEAADLCDHEGVREFLMSEVEVENCPKCGSDVSARDKFCRACGCAIV